MVWWTIILGAIDSDYKAAIFSGTENEGTIETRELELFPGHRSSITNVRPIVDATSTVTVKSRERLADTPTESSVSTMTDSGDNPVRESGRYFRFKITTPSGSVWTHAQGVDIVATRIGFEMTDKTDIDNVRYSFETQEFFQRQIEEAINALINEKNKENNKAYAWFIGD